MRKMLWRDHQSHCWTTFGTNIQYLLNTLVSISWDKYPVTSQQEPGIEMWLFRRDLCRTHLSMSPAPLNCTGDRQVWGILYRSVASLGWSGRSRGGMKRSTLCAEAWTQRTKLLALPWLKGSAVTTAGQWGELARTIQQPSDLEFYGKHRDREVSFKISRGGLQEVDPASSFNFILGNSEIIFSRVIEPLCNEYNIFSLKIIVNNKWHIIYNTQKTGIIY